MDYATVARTLSVDGEDFLLIEWGNEGIDVLDHPDDISPELGDAVLVDRNEVIGVIDPIGADRGNSVGIVKKVHNGRAVVEQGSRLTAYEVDEGVSVESANTVEISGAGVIQEVIETTAIEPESHHPASTDIDEYIQDLKFPAEDLDVGFEHFGGMSDHLGYVQNRVDLLLNQREEVKRIGRQPKEPFFMESQVLGRLTLRRLWLQSQMRISTGFAGQK